MTEDRISHYCVLEQVGRGGTGLVYRARDTRLERTVALKILPRSVIREPLAHARLLREARAASALDHPNICTVYEIGEDEEGRPFIAMAFCEGEDVQAKVARGPLELETALEIALQVAQGLEAAHQAGVVHRDVKPGNVLVSERGVVKLVDFGTAKILRPGEASTGQGLSGTPAYMSPEQLEGRPVDARADVWALGILLFEMLTGSRPFVGKGLTALLQAIVQSQPQQVGDLRPETPGMVSAIVERALRKDPADRYPSMTLMLEDLRTARRLLEEPTLPYPAGLVERRPPPRSSQLPWLVAGLLAVLAIGLIWYVRGPVRGVQPAALGGGSSSPMVAGTLTSDPQPAEAYDALGLGDALRGFDWDWSAAEQSFRAAVELNPRQAAAHQRYAELLSARGRHEAAAAAVASAREIEPLSPSIGHGVGLQRYLAGDPAGAAEAFRANLERAPDFWLSQVFLSLSQTAMGQSTEAVASARRAVELSGNATVATVAQAYALALAGERAQAEAILGELAAHGDRQEVSPALLACVDVALGERERALGNLERAVLERDPFAVFVGVMAPYEPLRGEPRFERVLAALGLRAGTTSVE